MSKARIIARRFEERTLQEPTFHYPIHFREEWRLRLDGTIEHRSGQAHEFGRTDGYPSPKWWFAAWIKQADEATFNQWIDLTLELRSLGDLTVPAAP